MFSLCAKEIYDNLGKVFFKILVLISTGWNPHLNIPVYTGRKLFGVRIKEHLLSTFCIPYTMLELHMCFLISHYSNGAR